MYYIKNINTALTAFLRGSVALLRGWVALSRGSNRARRHFAGWWRHARFEQRKNDKDGRLHNVLPSPPHIYGYSLLFSREMTLQITLLLLAKNNKFFQLQLQL